MIYFNQADCTWYSVSCLFFGSQFRLVNYFDSGIVRSLSAYFGKTRSEIGYGTIGKSSGVNSTIMINKSYLFSYSFFSVHISVFLFANIILIKTVFICEIYKFKVKAPYWIMRLSSIGNFAHTVHCLQHWLFPTNGL